MTLGTLLCKIANGNTEKNREQLKDEFLERIKGHNEEILLKECYSAACNGCTFIIFVENCLPPIILKQEGFWLKEGRNGFEYHFD